MFIILEIQTMANGTVAILPAVQKETRKEADSVYHSILAAAAISGLPVHSAVILTNYGNVVAFQSYSNEQE